MKEKLLGWMKTYCTILLLFLCASLRAQQGEPVFAPPLDVPMVFSGNFGEIRANHFHGGLDFKTEGRTGLKVRALAQGHIERIRVTHGSGYVLHVAYDNGYTTICRHLSAFVGDIARRVEALQYEQESWEVDIEPSPDEYPVSPGQVIALSGNTGYSFGPHLHLDVIEQATGESVDPLPFFRTHVRDHTPPRALGIMLFPRRGGGVVQGKGVPQTFPLRPHKPVEAWGWIGMAIRAYDYMDGVHNHYGVHTVILEMDGQEVFRSTVDRFSDDENLYINSWTEGGYMKSFIDPGNRLRMLRAAENRGWVNICEERPYHFIYILADALGNTSRVEFTVQGKPMPIPSLSLEEAKALQWNAPAYLSALGMHLAIPRGRLYKDEYVRYEVSADSADVAFTYRLADGKNIPLHGYAQLSIGLRHHPVEDSTKYYIATLSPRGKASYVGGTYRNGAMHARVRAIASYTVKVDTTPPRIIPVRPNTWGRKGRIVLKVSEKQSGLVRYRATIDGAYALMGKPNSVNGLLVCELDPRHVKRGRKHVLRVEVEDGCGNVSREAYDFVW